MRGTLAGICLLLATLLVPVAVTATWTELRVDDTRAYVDTVAPLADDPDLRAELADRAAETAVASLQEHVPLELPQSLDRMAHDAADTVVGSDDFPEFWRQANEDAHRQFLGVMRADPQGAAVVDGWVVVDLAPLMREVFQRLAEEGIPVEVLPEPSFDVPVIPKAKLVEVRGAYRAVNGMATWLPVVWVVLVGIAVALGRGLRGRLRVGGLACLGVAAGAGLVWLASGPVTELVVDQADPGQQPLVRLVAEVVIDRLASWALGLVVVGGMVGLGLLLVSLAVRRERRGDGV